ncbi:MAG: glutamate 5-kinase [Terracidiphilus sp.]|nr:glutamate 5-kinase [Terracidiphilus sp.]
MRFAPPSKKTIVIKIGTSSLLSDDGFHPKLSMVAKLTEAAVRLRESGHAVVIVTSGAVGFGCVRMKLASRPTSIVAKQALAAVGQSSLMRIYDEFFTQMGHTCAQVRRKEFSVRIVMIWRGPRACPSFPPSQVLLTYECFGDRNQYLNARNTLGELLRLGVIPIVNENDTVAVQELMFGDNDSLGAQVAAVVGADWYFMFTDVDAVYTSDPRVSVPVCCWVCVRGMRAVRRRGRCCRGAGASSHA